VDLGSATTFEVVSNTGICLGGAILPGLQMQMRALNKNTANLPPVRIQKMTSALGHSTTTNIQSGLYFGHLGAIQAILKSIIETQFADNHPVILGTGGFSSLYEQAGIFSIIVPDLVLQGLRFAYTSAAKKSDVTTKPAAALERLLG
jgi:type III pantothenate kinase